MLCSRRGSGPLLSSSHPSLPLSRSSRPRLLASCDLVGKACTDRSTLTRDMLTQRASRMLGSTLSIRSLRTSKRLDLMLDAELIRRRFGPASASGMKISLSTSPVRPYDATDSLFLHPCRAVGCSELRTGTSRRDNEEEVSSLHRQRQWKQFPLARCVEVDDDGG
jgi:hypothetical protein